MLTGDNRTTADAVVQLGQLLSDGQAEAMAVAALSRRRPGTSASLIAASERPGPSSSIARAMSEPEIAALIRTAGRGRWMDNVFIERLWRSLEYEGVYLHDSETGSELRAGVGRWFDY